jgi:hypothetical protein
MTAEAGGRAAEASVLGGLAILRRAFRHAEARPGHPCPYTLVEQARLLLLQVSREFLL